MARKAKVIGVIPARFSSTRFPGKPLALLGNRYVIEWVYRAAKKALKDVVVATDDRRILAAVDRFGGEAMMTSKKCKTGTDRVREVARKRKADFYVNIQGDEPFLDPAALKKTVALALARNSPATLAVSVREKEARDSHVVKVVTDRKKRALYFSRSPIPARAHGNSKPLAYLKHVGLYVFPRKTLNEFSRWPQTPLEKAEKLEQLRLLENGGSLYVHVGRKDSPGIDTPQDLKKASRKLSRLGLKQTRI